MQLVVGFDIDGVLTDIEKFQFENGTKFFRKMYQKGIVNPRGETIQDIFGATAKEEKAFWTKYLLKYLFLTPARKGSKQISNKIRDNKDKLVIITSRAGTDKDTKAGKAMRIAVKKWLDANSIHYDDIVFTTEKREVIKKYNVDIMIEDTEENIVEISKDIPVLCMHAKKNEFLEGQNIIRVHNMKDAEREYFNFKQKKEKEEIDKRFAEEIRPLSGIPSIDKLHMRFYTNEEKNIILPSMTIYEYLYENNKDNLDKVAIYYYGREITYRTLFNEIDKCAKSFIAYGIREGDVVAVCLPNIPQAIFAFYALNKIGAVPNMIDVLKSKYEISDEINSVNSKMLITITKVYSKIDDILDKINVKDTVIAKVNTWMGLPTKLHQEITAKEIINKDRCIDFKDFINKGKTINQILPATYKKGKRALIMHTSGSSGPPKGVELTDDNYNCMVHQQKATAKNFDVGDKMLTIMPVFHGFGLCSSVHMPLSYGISVILMAKFDSQTIHKTIAKYQPNHIFGVPALFKAFIVNKHIQKMNLSFLKYVVSGGEGMTVGFEKEFNEFLFSHDCRFSLKKGYGQTEATAGTTLSDDYSNELGSVGPPLVCNNFKIVKPGTQEELSYNEEGEICVTGPTIMNGYVPKNEQTDQANTETLQKHKDGKIWLHTRDIGCNNYGFIRCTGRLSRMYISSGRNINPEHIQRVIAETKEIEACAVVPTQHPYKDIQVPVAYVIVKDHNPLNQKTLEEIKTNCLNNLDKYHQPYRYEKIDAFPLNKVGKVDYKLLEQQAATGLVKVKRR